MRRLSLFSTRPPGRSRFRLVPIIALLVGLSAAVLAAGSKDSQWTRIVLNSPMNETALRVALTGASDWLTDDGCRGVFAEFKDANGSPLTEKLATLGVDEATYLGYVVFRDGSRMPQCKSPITVMFTAPGYRIVFVCEKQFFGQWQTDRTRLRALVLHEILHTLGLGENPPSSAHITERVLARCFFRKNGQEAQEAALLPRAPGVARQQRR
jgi:hypothetical protein